MKRAILCVDDEALIVLSLKQELRSHYGDRFIYETALSAEAALEVIGDLKAEGVEGIALVTDWLMPGIKGDALIDLARDRYPDIYAVIITGHADVESLDRLRAGGALVAVLMKPWSRSELIAAVEACLRAATV
jgi:CheY-like chemotaxis protein